MLTFSSRGLRVSADSETRRIFFSLEIVPALRTLYLRGRLGVAEQRRHGAIDRIRDRPQQLALFNRHPAVGTHGRRARQKDLFLERPAGRGRVCARRRRDASSPWKPRAKARSGHRASPGPPRRRGKAAAAFSGDDAPPRASAESTTFVGPTSGSYVVYTGAARARV